jgi:Rieske Fe-S protein
MTDDRADDRADDRTVNRRTWLGGVAVLGATGLITAACGSSSTATNTATPTATPTVETSTGPAVLGKAADIPVGGGQIFASERIVVTQPKAGEYLGFSSTCTHQGCQVESVSKGFIACPCHGSMYAIATGVPTADSPAKTPLAKVNVTVQNGDIVVT